MAGASRGDRVRTWAPVALLIAVVAALSLVILRPEQAAHDHEQPGATSSRTEASQRQRPSSRRPTKHYRAPESALEADSEAGKTKRSPRPLQAKRHTLDNGLTVMLVEACPTRHWSPPDARPFRPSPP